MNAWTVKVVEYLTNWIQGIFEPTCRIVYCIEKLYIRTCIHNDVNRMSVIEQKCDLWSWNWSCERDNTRNVYLCVCRKRVFDPGRVFAHLFPVPHFATIATFCIVCWTGRFRSNVILISATKTHPFGNWLLMPLVHVARFRRCDCTCGRWHNRT